MEDVQRVSEAACGLERLSATIRRLSSAMVSLDAYDRWGARTDEDHARAFQETQELGQASNEATAKLEALLARLRAEEPEAVAAWAAAHVRLREHFLEHLVEGPRNRTERFVAKEEIDAWKALATGEGGLVDENTFYVTLDPELYGALFPGVER